MNVLRRHIRDFGFTHAEIARRSARLDQATAYRVIEGETRNPSLRSITGIVEATALTDADAGVLYRQLADGRALPKLQRPPAGLDTHAAAAVFAKDALDSGRLREAAYGVMAMFDLANTDDERADAYEQAGIVYMGLGRWEEARANLEAADALLPGDVHDPALPQAELDRKLALMTNLGSLLVHKGNASWAGLFGRTVAQHPRATPNNRGWGWLVLGEAALSLGTDASEAFAQADRCFQKALDGATTERSRNAAQGNLRWTRVHRLHAQGDLEGLAELEASWDALDPEASAMAGLFHAQGLSERRRRLKLRDVKARASRLGLGDIARRAAALLTAALVLVSLGTVGDVTPAPEGPTTHERGNTGGKKGG